MKSCANWQEKLCDSRPGGVEKNPNFEAQNPKQAQNFKTPMFPTRPF
jgi:hypothetical protein